MLGDDQRWRKGYWWALCCTVGDGAEVERSPVHSIALDCLNHFAGDEASCEFTLSQVSLRCKEVGA